jgi:sterol desaturase/sphingolipid hydroxylase (fatty acid hydroxylase superfamily)
MFILYFLLWLFVLYWIHRLAHRIPIVNKFHLAHHSYVNKNEVTWHWNNLFLYNDNIRSTIDLWITEVVPTIIFCLIFNCWYIFIFYYLWAAFLQERLEHNKNVDLPILTSGKWHLIHHKAPYNYGLLIPMWDMVFRTYKKVT